MHRMRTATGLTVTIALVVAIPAVAAGKSDPSVLNGAYRVGWTEQQLVAAGASRTYAHNNHGVLTLTLRDGRLHLHNSVPPPLSTGTYAVSGKSAVIRITSGGHLVLKTSWSLHDGQLRLGAVVTSNPGDAIEWGA